MENETIALSRTDIDDIVKDVRALVRKLKNTMSKAKTKVLQTFFYTELGKAFLQYDPVLDQVKFIKVSTMEPDGVWHYLANWRSKEEAFKQLQKIKDKNPNNQRVVRSIDSVICKINQSRKRYVNHWIVQSLNRK